MTVLRRLDLGSGTKQRPGFLTLDRFPLPGVRVVGDLDGPSLPFGDDSFDLVVAFHSLEHVADLMHCMREVWRVCRPGAEVCVTAPYWSSQLNLANPYHLQRFNEHTPRFWTTCSSTSIDPLEWWEPPFSRTWGLGASDHSDPGLDLRCIRMEMFYFTEWWTVPEVERLKARKHQLNVCEQVLYHLRAVKPIGGALPAGNEQDLYMPPELDARRAEAAAAATGAGD